MAMFPKQRFSESETSASTRHTQRDRRRKESSTASCSKHASYLPPLRLPNSLTCPPLGPNFLFTIITLLLVNIPHLALCSPLSDPNTSFNDTPATTSPTSGSGMNATTTATSSPEVRMVEDDHLLGVSKDIWKGVEPAAVALGIITGIVAAIVLVVLCIKHAKRQRARAAARDNALPEKGEMWELSATADAVEVWGAEKAEMAEMPVGTLKAGRRSLLVPPAGCNGTWSSQNTIEDGTSMLPGPTHMYHQMSPIQESRWVTPPPTPELEPEPEPEPEQEPEPEPEPEPELEPEPVQAAARAPLLGIGLQEGWSAQESNVEWGSKMARMGISESDMLRTEQRWQADEDREVVRQWSNLSR
ncbi:hypothetical protein BDZ91DRAFT_797253 [Kalaharituber pfeilii]|nr:hypothetical protein BDZ91DRAFT_797253 [Kalaharituber pfeilii]